MPSVSSVDRRHVQSSLPGYLEKIIDKKVDKIALSCLETFVHWILITFSCFYPKYKAFYEARNCGVQGKKFVDTTHLLDRFADKERRLHHFPDGVGLFDLTDRKIVLCMPRSQGCFMRPLKSSAELDLYLNQKVVMLNVLDLDPTHPFSKENNTDYVTVQNIPKASNKIKITEHKMNGTTKDWTIDMSKEFIQYRRYVTIEGLTRRYFRVYVAEESIPRIQDPSYLRPKPVWWFW